MAEHLVDLSGLEINVGDILFIDDTDKEDTHTFRVEDVVQRDEANRAIRVRTIKSQTLPLNSLHNMIVNAAIPTFGRIRKHDEVKKHDFDPLEYENFVINELRVYLDAKPKLQDSVKNIVTYMQLHKVLDSGDTEADKVRLLQVANSRKDLFMSKGGWVKSNGVPYDSPMTSLLPGMINASRKVKLSKLYLGIRLILESGLFGDIEIEND